MKPGVLATTHALGQPEFAVSQFCQPSVQEPVKVGPEQDSVMSVVVVPPVLAREVRCIEYGLHVGSGNDAPPLAALADAQAKRLLSHANFKLGCNLLGVNRPLDGVAQPANRRQGELQVRDSGDAVGIRTVPASSNQSVGVLVFRARLRHWAICARYAVATSSTNNAT